MMQVYVEGKLVLLIQIGNVVWGVIMVCDLVVLGVFGLYDSFEGFFGYFVLFEDSVDLLYVVLQLGKMWCIVEVSYKFFLIGCVVQGGIVLM